MLKTPSDALIKIFKRELLRKLRLADNADKIIHHPLKSMPDDLKGLCRMRVGDYRIIYWIYHQKKSIKIYEIEHRSQGYRSERRK